MIPSNVSALADALVEEFGIDRDRAIRRAYTLIDQLYKAGWVVEAKVVIT